MKEVYAMKRIIILLGILIFFCGCSATYQLITPFAPPDTRAAEEYAKLDNEVALESTFSTEYPAEILRKWYFYYVMWGASSRDLIQDIASELPVDNLRQADGWHYSVYKIKDGGRLFLFFEGNENSLRCTTTLYSERRLQKSDFDGIKAGDSLDKVIAVDPTAKCLREYFSEEEHTSPMTRHLLTDGTLYINYTLSDGAFFVKDLQYNPEFQIGEFTCKILPQDYPQG
jgi:hypothetical protein